MDLSDAPDDMTGKVIEFALTTPGTPEIDAANVAYALSLNLPEASRKHLTIIANGPSSRQAPLDGDTLALNGSLELFLKEGGYPTYWMACDPQAEVADFLIDPPEQTEYLLASHCHRSVFDMLWDRKITLWHRSDAQGLPEDTLTIPVAISVTMSALQWALRHQYNDVDVWGWDCCFAADGAHHAGHGAILDELPLEVQVGPERIPFRTKRAWAAEAQDAAYVLPILQWAGMNIRIHGGGMVAAVVEEFAAPAPLKAA